MPGARNPRQPAPKQPRAYRPAAERRAQILSAAQAVFVRSNFQGARTRDIASEAGVNEATLFKHFPSKEALFEAAVMAPLIAGMRDMHSRIEMYEAARTPTELAKLAEASTLRHLEDMHRLFPLLTAALFSDFNIGRKLFRKQLEPLIRQRGEVLRPLVKEGVDPAFVGLASFGMMFAVAMQRWFGSQQDDLAATAAQFNRLSTGGFAREHVSKRRRKGVSAQ